MKKIITLIIAMLLITTTTYAYTLTKEIAGRQMISTINSGTVVSLIYNDIAGYTFTGWSSSDIAITNAGSKSISFTMPAKNVKIVANVTKNVSHTHSYSTATCTTPPTCSCGATQGSALGHDYTGTVTCNQNGSTDTVKCIRCTATTSKDCTHTYTITVTQGTNGTINPGTTTVKAGANQSFTITPNSNYEVSSVKVDNVDQGAKTSYEFNKITANHTITASFAPPAIIANKDVAIGKYIRYTPSSTSYKVYESDSGYGTDDSNANEYQEFNPSQTTSWRVMYNNNGQLDIISAESIGGLYLNGANGYTKAVNTLSNLSKAYINSKYATGARALGETSSSVGTIDTATYPLTVNVSGAPYTDTTYTNDVNQLKNNSMLHSSGYVWLASRLMLSYSSASSFNVRDMDSSGSVYYGYLYGVYSDGSPYLSSRSYGVCPVVSLDSGIRVVSGSGTSEDPYIITK